MLQHVLRAVDGVHQIVRSAIGPVFVFVDEHMIIRRAIVLVVLWQLVDAYIWAKGYAMREGMNGLELGAVISAILIPATALQTLLFKMYSEFRKEPREAD